MKLAYITPARLAYYVAVAVTLFVVKAIAEPTLGAGKTTALIAPLMGLLLVIDAKIMPEKISFLRPVLPGIGWIDLAVAFAVCIGFAWYAYHANQTVDRREFMIGFVLLIGPCFLIGIASLFRWQRWRGRK